MPSSPCSRAAAAIIALFVVSAPLPAGASANAGAGADRSAAPTGRAARRIGGRERERALFDAAAAAGLRPAVLRLALKAHARATRAGLTDRPTLTVIDYSLLSRVPRLWVLDLADGSVLANELVAHGRETGGDSAYVFSNRPGSLQSSLGTMITGAIYDGKHGRSLRLRGIDAGINDNAERRAIVVHGADYVDTAIVGKLGRLGRSQGCPALSPAAARRVIDLIQGGTVLFAYYPSRALERTLAGPGQAS